jgi:hypothetical protein
VRAPVRVGLEPRAGAVPGEYGRRRSPQTRRWVHFAMNEWYKKAHSISELLAGGILGTHIANLIGRCAHGVGTVDSLAYRASGQCPRSGRLSGKQMLQALEHKDVPQKQIPNLAPFSLGCHYSAPSRNHCLCQLERPVVLSEQRAARASQPPARHAQDHGRMLWIDRQCPHPLRCAD